MGELRSPPSRSCRDSCPRDPHSARDSAAVAESRSEGRGGAVFLDTARRAYDLIAQNFGPGVNGPLIVAVSLGSPANGTSDSRLTTLEQDVSRASGVVAISPIQIDKAGTTAYFNAIAKYGPADTKTADLVGTLSSSVIPNAENGSDMKAYVGGTTAGYVDLASNVSSKLPLQILVVIALSFLLVVLAFRTLVVPVRAALMNVLSIGAAYGVLTALFQFGWLHSLIDLEGSVPIVSYVPLFMFAILFGLSMDYEVFLVSQIEEHVHAGEDNKNSVVKGLVTSARVITAAATIMVFVFGRFVLNGDPTVKQFGVGLAVAVILDATVVRCLLAPALMIMMGQVTGTCPHGSIDSSLTSASRAWSSSRSVRHALRASSSRIFDLLCGCSGAAT